MDDLLKMASELMENDNYKNSSGDYPTIPDGDYASNIDKIEFRTSSKGTEYINITVTIVDGDFTGQKMFIPFYLSEKALKPSLSRLMTLITSCGYTLDASMFTDFDTLVECLQSLINTVVTVKKKTNGEYINYSMVGGAE